MAMTTGSVRCLHVGEFLGITRIVGRSGSELFILWTAQGNLTAWRRVLRNMWVSQLRDAYANGLFVQIVHDDDSNVISGVRSGIESIF